MENEISPGERVADLVLARPALAEVLERFAIDYCCGGQRTLEDACRQRGLEVAAVVHELGQVVERGEAPTTDWTKLRPSALADHIEATHHSFLRRELPRLNELFDKVVSVHRLNHPELLEGQRVFRTVREELEPHLEKEERVLFPLIRRLEESRRHGQSADASDCGSIENPILAMEFEHQAVGSALTKMRAALAQYQPPADACGSYRVLLDGLIAFERDLHEHIHKENNLLFAKARELSGS